MSQSAAFSSQVDLRGFDYALEPLQRKQQWRLDALQTRLARARSQESLAQTRLRAKQTAYRHELVLADQALQRHLDPQALQRTMAYLAQMAQQVHEADQTVANCRQARRALVQECIVQQQKLDTLSRHREECLLAYVAETSRLELAQADRDWIVHRHVRSLQILGLSALTGSGNAA